jgi:carbonic anhydrase/acetyltransferase-like protein (isoleucine patch superfamily)
MQCSDWNAVSFGDDCVVDGFLQFHTLEDMMLKVKRTHIQDRCTVAFGATVMGGSVIERDTTLSPLSLVLKEMTLPTATYEGSPAEPVSGANLRHQSPRADEAGGYFRVAESAAE